MTCQMFSNQLRMILKNSITSIINNNMQKKLLENFPTLNPQEWSATLKNESLIVTNNFTVDEFRLQKVSANSWHLHQIYKARSQYAIPNTPQLIIAAHQSDTNFMQMLVQTAPLTLDRLIKRNACQCSIQQLIKSVLKTIQILVKKFGFFRITPQMVRVTRSHCFLVWVHENFSSNHRQYPLGSSNICDDYRTMISDILSLFQIAGYKRQLQNVRVRINQQKILSFEKFKTIIQNQLRCHELSKEKSEKVMYRSPQFLKRKNSPDPIRRGVTQNFLYEKYPQAKSRFATTLNIPAKISKSNTYVSRQKQQAHSCSGQETMRILSNDPSINNIQMNKDQQQEGNFLGERCSIKYHKSYTGQPNSENIDIKKNFRESGNSVSTTAFLTSITSSGKIKLNSQEHNLLNIHEEKKCLVSSAGVKQGRRLRELKETFKVKESKIIQQKCQEQILNTAQSMIKGQKSSDGLEVSYDYQNEFDGILKSEGESSFQKSSQLMDLQAEISNILTG